MNRSNLLTSRGVVDGVGGLGPGRVGIGGLVRGRYAAAAPAGQAHPDVVVAAGGVAQLDLLAYQPHGDVIQDVVHADRRVVGDLAGYAVAEGLVKGVGAAGEPSELVGLGGERLVGGGLRGRVDRRVVRCYPFGQRRVELVQAARPACSGRVDRKRMRSVRFQRSILPLAAPSRTAAWQSTMPRPPQISDSWSLR